MTGTAARDDREHHEPQRKEPQHMNDTSPAPSVPYAPPSEFRRLQYGALGMRRIDGEPWPTDPASDGDVAWWSRGDEVTPDAMVMVLGDLRELVYGVIAQNDTNATDGPLLDVRVTAVALRTHAGSPSRLAWFDIAPDDLIREAESMARAMIDGAIRLARISS